MNESHIQGVPQGNGLIFHIGEVSELWRKTDKKIVMFSI